LDALKKIVLKDFKEIGLAYRYSFPGLEIMKLDNLQWKSEIGVKCVDKE